MDRRSQPAVTPERASAGADAAARYGAVRAATLGLIRGLSPEDCVVQSMPLASPLKWHLAHTTWFFETFVLERAQRGFRPFDPAFRVLFNSYYNGIGEQYSRPDRGLLTRPSLERVLTYREQVDRAMLETIGAAAGTGVAALVETGLHHEQQHQELMITDLKHLLSRNPLHPVYRRTDESARVEPDPARWHRHDEGLHRIGHGGDDFRFDNETPRHRVFVHAFELASRPVSNAEFAEFVADGGYREPRLWLADGWDAVRREGWGGPAYWLDDGRCFTLGGARERRPDEPVCHVSYYEADAYARWAGARLPTEAEWEVAAERHEAPGVFAEDGPFHPGALPAAAGGAPQRMLGDVWEWTQSPYVAYPGYRPPEGALGEYNGKFMCNQLVLRGASCATPRSHARTTYRNFFYPDARWQFSGLRLARDAA